jgi:Helix-turn-helix of DDE superfamily endonuclease
MELSYGNIKIKPGLIKSATGLSKAEFEYLLPAFGQEWDRHMGQYTFEGKPRIRMCKARKNNTFKEVEDMLVFILYDYRHNPTQEFMGLHFHLTQPKVAMWIKILEPILAKCLDRLKLLPARESAKLGQCLIESVTILLDGSERPINRPKYDQEEYYSGKKSSIP